MGKLSGEVEVASSGQNTQQKLMMYITAVAMAVDS